MTSTGLLADLGGVRAAYGLGVLVSVVALAAAVRAVPAPPAGRSASVDVPGASLLAAGLCCVLVVLSETPGLSVQTIGVGVTVRWQR